MRNQPLRYLFFHWLVLGTAAFDLKFPWDSKSSQKGGLDLFGKADPALQPGDTVAVIGASGNVGKLVALRLSDTYKVNGVVRDASKVSDFLDRESIDLFEANLVDCLDAENSSSYPASLKTALETANAIVVCTGTTAFPTKAWTKSGDSEVAGEVINALASNSFDVKSAIASLDAQGLNTPVNVDSKANKLLLDVWKDFCKVRRKRFILLSSIGVQRRDQMPFPVLNACGVLDAKAEGESAIQAAAESDGFSYTFIRPGQLFGGPYDNNYYLGTLFQLDKDAKTQDVEVAAGDSIVGDTLRSTLAEVTAQVCEGDLARDMDFAVVNVKGDTPTDVQVKERLGQLS